VKERQWQQDKLLSGTEIARLKLSDIDIHELKGGRNASKRDLYKDGEGFGEPTGLNINDF
jgi:Bacterial toxin 33